MKRAALLLILAVYGCAHTRTFVVRVPNRACWEYVQSDSLWSHVLIDSIGMDQNGRDGAYRTVAFTSAGVLGWPDCVCLMREAGDSCWVPTSWLKP